MEFKGQIERYITKSVDNINRITVEFKAFLVIKIVLSNVILIESQWNLKNKMDKDPFLTVKY